MKKTLLVTIDSWPDTGGVATYWSKVVKSLPKEKLVVLAPKSKDSEHASNVYRASLFFRFIWPRWLKGVYQIYRVFKKENCKSIIVGQVLPVGSMVYILHRLFKIPYVVQVYGTDLFTAKKSKRKFLLAKRVLQSADQVIVNSQYVGQLLSKDYEVGVDKYSVIYPLPEMNNNIDREIVDGVIEKYKLENKKVVLTVARLVPRKGQDNTIRAMSAVLEKHLDCVYVIVGDGDDMARLKKLAAPIAENVKFVGKQTGENVKAFYSLCDVYVGAGREEKDDIEGFGISFLEANLFGKPVVAGRAGGAIEAVKENKSGLVVDGNSVDEISRAILLLLNDPEKAKQMGEYGKRRIAEEFNWDKMLSQLTEKL